MRTLSFLTAWLACLCAATAADSPINISTKLESGKLEVEYKGRKLLVYSFATNQCKPYVQELYTLRGENVLRDSPPDHLHHHGLMYALYVNGINFWEEKVDPGIEKHVEIPLRTAKVGADGMPTATFTEVIYWLAPTNRDARDSYRAALLLEERKLTVRVDEKAQELALLWESKFQVGRGAEKVKLHGPNYDGLGLRLPESFNHVAQFQNSAGTPYTGKNSQNVIPAQWTSVSGKMAGQDVMLVMFGSKANAHAPTLFFTMLDPFAYLSATQGVDKQPLEYGAGETFAFAYLLTVYSENKPAEFINRRYKQWEQPGN